MALETSYMVVRVAITQSLSITEYTKQAAWGEASLHRCAF